MPQNQFSNTSPDSTGHKDKKQKIAKNEGAQNHWGKLPPEIAKLILSHVHCDEKSDGLLPHYAMVNKEFYRFFSSLTIRSYEIMIHCLIGPAGFERLTKDKNISVKDYKSAFLYIKDKVNKLAKEVDFGYINEILTTESGPILQLDYLDSYDPDTKKFNIRFGKKGNTGRRISRNKLLDYLFNITPSIKQELDSLTPNPDCYSALIAFAYLTAGRKNNNQLIYLTTLYTQAGFTRGTLFILEFCQTYQLQNRDDDSQPLLQSNKKSIL